MDESSDTIRPWWKTVLSWIPRIHIPTGSALTILLCLAISAPALTRVTNRDDAGGRFDLEAGVLDSITVYRLITYIFFHDDVRALACSCLTIWYFGGGFEETVGTVKFCFLTPLFAVCIGLIYLAVLSTGLSLPVGDGRVQGFTAVAFCMMSAFSTRTRIRRLPFFGFMVPVRLLPLFFLFPALLIPHSPVFSNMCGILVGVLYSLGGCFCLDLPESFLSRLEQMLPFRLLKRIPFFKYIPASTAERNASQTRKINPPPGSYPVQQYYTPQHDLPNSYSPYHHMKPAGNGPPYGHPAGSSSYPIGIAPGAFHQTAHVCTGGHSHTHTSHAPTSSELTHVQTQ